jgi:hypothetical protein
MGDQSLPAPSPTTPLQSNSQSQVMKRQSLLTSLPWATIRSSWAFHGYPNTIRTLIGPVSPSSFPPSTVWHSAFDPTNRRVEIPAALRSQATCLAQSPQVCNNPRPSDKKSSGTPSPVPSNNRLLWDSQSRWFRPNIPVQQSPCAPPSQLQSRWSQSNIPVLATCMTRSSQVRNPLQQPRHFLVPRFQFSPRLLPRYPL